MARPNYTAAKRARELKRKAKREAKLARKHARKVEHSSTGDPSEAPAPDSPAEHVALPESGSVPLQDAAEPVSTGGSAQEP